MEELEKAKLLSVATKLAQAQIQEVREELLEQINLIQIPDAINGRDGRDIVDARIFEGQLVLQLSDGVLVTAGSVIGEQGPVGPVGARGEKGDKGDPGPRGDKGDHGVPGLEGPRGVKGDKGDKGDTGQQGERGEQGPEGIPGKRGQRGERGEQGPSGVDGTSGSDGAKGETGERGPQGVSGRDGKNGKDGAQGPVGSVGPKGDKGDTGDRGEKGDKGDPGSDVEVLKLEKKLEQFEQDVDKRISKVAFNAAMTGASPGSGEVLLHRLDDVDYNSVKIPTNGQALVWNVAIGKWAAGTVAAGGGASNQLVNGSYNVTLQANSALRLPSGAKLISGFPGFGQYLSNFATLAGDYAYLSSANGYAYIGVENQIPVIGNGPNMWAFDPDGTIRFPDNTIQSTAYTGGGGGTTNVASYLQVANANAKFATKAYTASNTYVNNTFLKKTGLRSQSQSVNTNVSFAANVAITGDLIITGTEYDKGLAINGNRGNIYLGNDTRDARTIVVTNSLTGYYSGFQVRRAGADLWYTGAHPNETYILRSGANNDVMIANNTSGVNFTGNVRLAAGVIANNSLGSAGYVLKTNGSSVYWSAAVSTNYLQVANAVSTYTTKSNPTTSGLLAHTGRATVSTNLAVSGNTALGGLLNVNYTGSANASIVVQGTNTKGGAGYHDFLMARNGGGGTNPSKWFRINSTGGLELINSAYTANILSLTDAGDLNVKNSISINGSVAVNGPAFSAYPTSPAQTITSGSLQRVNLGNEVYDTNGNFDAPNGKFTPTVAGYYQFEATIRIDGSSGTGEYMIVVYKNGSEYKRGTNNSGTEAGSNFFTMQVSCQAYANGTGDYFELYVQQGSGSNRTIQPAQNISYFQGMMVRGA